MKKIRPFLAGVTAGICMIAAGSLNGITAWATTRCGNVNNDGDVTLSDLVVLNKYLCGQYELTDYAAADTNANYIVEYVDTLILNAYLTEVISSLPYTG